MTSPEPQTDFGENVSQREYEPSPQPRRWLWLLLAFTLIIGGTTAIVWRLLTPVNQPPANTKAQAPGVRVKISPVQIGTVEESTDFITSLQPRNSIQLQPRIQGQVTQVFVKPGYAIAAGAPIAQIDSTKQQPIISGIENAQVAKLNLDNARAILNSLQAQRLSYIADVQLNQQEYNKYANLAAQGAVSRQTRDQYADKLSTARTNLGTINSKIQAQLISIRQVENALQQSQTNTGKQQAQYYTITAPFAGVVSEMPVKVGDFVNTSTQLVSITQNRPLEVSILIPLSRRSQLRKGMPVEIINTQGQILGDSRVFFISPVINNNNTQATLIKAVLNNSNSQLQAQQLVRARVIWNQRSGVLVPNTAVSRVAGQTFVYVAQMQTSPQGISQLIARQKSVKLGNIRGNTSQVLEGLQPEDNIVISGLLNLRDSVPIVADSQ